MTNLDKSKIVQAYLARTPTSRALSDRALQVFPSGVTHDSRYLRPYPIYIARGEGSRKWDVDGHEYVDYSGGHGALLLGHNYPQVVAAVEARLRQGTHFGAGHRLEIEWGEIVQRLIPSAERIRFTSSGTEATMLAIRLARAYTGRSKILRFLGHFHGWHDQVAFGVGSHFDGTPSVGVVDGLAREVVLAPSGDLAATERLLRAGDVAAAMLEPTGASWGKIPLPEGFLAELRASTEKHGTLLIFDEVISGFRCAPGGAQGYFGVTPDLTTLAKILAGGFPGGAVAGRSDVMQALSFDLEGSATPPEAGRREKISHQGTFNANPISAAAGIATLAIVESTDACQRANDFGARLRESLDRALHDAKVPWIVYGSFSGFHIFTNPRRLNITRKDVQAGKYDHRVLKDSSGADVENLLRVAMLVEGVDMMGWPGGPTSAVHTDDDLCWTVSAFQRALASLKQEGAV